jgi:hypothetical protein
VAEERNLKRAFHPIELNIYKLLKPHRYRSDDKLLVIEDFLKKLV